MYTLKSYRAMLNLCLRANNGSDTSSETPDTPSETPDTPNFEGVVNLLGLPDDAKGELLTILNDGNQDTLNSFLTTGNGKDINDEIKNKLRELVDGIGNAQDEARTLLAELQQQVSAAPAESGEVATTEYTVERGDNLTKLARKFNTTIDELIDLQDEPLKSRLTKNRNLIYIGEMLKVAGESPAGTPAGESPAGTPAGTPAGESPAGTPAGEPPAGTPAGTPAGEPPELNDGDISTINDIVKKLFTYYGDSGLDSYDKGDFYGISLGDIRNNKRDVSLFLVSKIGSEFAENEEFIKNNGALQEALIKSINIISEYLKAEGVSLEDSLTIKNLTAKSMPYGHNQTRDNPFFQPFQDFVTSQIG